MLSSLFCYVLNYLKNGGSRAGRWDVDNGGVRFDSGVSLGHRVEHGQTKVLLASLA